MSRFERLMAGVGPAASRCVQARGRVQQLAAGHDPVHEAEPGRVGGAQVVAEEHELLGDLRADEPGEQVGAAPVGDDAAPDEHLDEPGVLGGQDEVGREREVRPEARRGAVHRADDRLVAVLEGGDETLGAEARAVHREDRPGGGARR